MKTVAIIQARMGSTRLPGKVLMDIVGEPMLARVVERTRRARTLDEVLVATTVQPGDDPIEQLCQSRDWECFRGSERDVLDRYYQAARAYQAGAVVRITGDCPLIDPGIVDRVVREFHDRQPLLEYATNFVPVRTYPRGLDTQVIRLDVLERLWRDDEHPAWREHVTYYIDLKPELFNVHNVVNDVDYSHLRWTVDTAEDLCFVRQVYGHFAHDRFEWDEVLRVLSENPEWIDINRGVKTEDLASPGQAR